MFIQMLNKMNSKSFVSQHSRLFGIYDMMKPVFFARDLDFIKQITIKDFDYFEDHIGFIDSSADKLFGNSLFMLEGM